MNEFFLHFIWQYGLFDQQELQTDCGLPVKIISRGHQNKNSGPDFMESSILLGNTEWAGHVEIHVNGSEWFEHGHHQDNAYDNTILHVVLNNDKPAVRTDGTEIPTLSLAGKIKAGYFNRWRELEGNLAAIPCAMHQPSRYESAALSMRHRALTERFILKAGKVSDLAREAGNDWEHILFRLICRYMGFRVNSNAMEMLAAVLPPDILRKVKSDIISAEALFFGQAGLLKNDIGEEYWQLLSKTYQFLRRKWNLPQALDPVIWKFGRLRPGNFPTIRIAQLASLCHSEGFGFSNIILAEKLENVQQILSVQASEYWDSHYRPGVTSNEHAKILGKDSVAGLIINAVVPAMFVYARHTGNENLREKAFDWLSRLPAEKNAITRAWEMLGLKNRDAYDSQSLTGLREMYCLGRRCLDCSIGQAILKNEDKMMIA